MVTLEQVEQLDKRVHKVVDLVESLRRENTRLYSENRHLVEENRRLQSCLQEMERRSLSVVGNQEIFEKGLVGAIDRLGILSSDMDSLNKSGHSFPFLSPERQDGVGMNSVEKKTSIFHEAKSISFIGDLPKDLLKDSTQENYNSSVEERNCGDTPSSYRMEIF